MIVLFQNKSCTNTNTSEPKIDTVIVYKYIKDTIYVDKPTLVYTKPDTVWQIDTVYRPSNSYLRLLTQYTSLGNKYFATNIFKNRFEIADYGHVEVIDSVKENKIISSTITTDLKIPTTTITIEKERPAKSQLFVGPRVIGNSTLPISGVFGDILLKTKNDKIYGLSIGWTGEITYGANLYYPIKFKRQ